MRTKKVIAIIEASPSGYGVYSDELPGITAFGKTVEKAKEDILVAIKEVMKVHKEEGTIPPKWLHEGNIELVYKYDIASLFEYFGMLDVTNFASRIGINSSLLRQYKTGHALASVKQKKKIEAGIHQLGKELLRVRL